MKRRIAVFIAALCFLGITGCAKTEQVIEEPKNTPVQTAPDTTESAEPEPSGSPSSASDAGEATADEILDSFIAGSISAFDSADPASTFYMTDLNMDPEESDSYSIGDRVDLDNDGENELIICGPYGGIYLDARDNKVYEFAAGDGTDHMLSYVVYNGATWIMYSNRMYTGYESYHMEKFEGADNLAAEMDFNEELVDEDNPEGEEKYTLNGTEISYNEYAELCSKIFAAEVYTD